MCVLHVQARQMPSEKIVNVFEQLHSCTGILCILPRILESVTTSVAGPVLHYGTAVFYICLHVDLRPYRGPRCVHSCTILAKTAFESTGFTLSPVYTFQTTLL